MNLNKEQERIVAEFCSNYDIEPSQITFAAGSTEPIFDYEALNVLRLALTDIVDITPEIAERTDDLVTVRTTAILSDDRSTSDLGTCAIGDTLASGKKVETHGQAQDVALSRAVRRVIRSSGYNLVRAHKQFMDTGKRNPVKPALTQEQRLNREIHALARDIGHIAGDDRTKYEEFLENSFGVRSSLDLDDLQKSQLVSMYRSILTGIKDAVEHNGVSQKAA